MKATRGDEPESKKNKTEAQDLKDGEENDKDSKTAKEKPTNQHRKIRSQLAKRSSPSS